MDLYKADLFKNRFPNFLCMKMIAKGLHDVRTDCYKLHKATLTGVTVLKEGRYKSRYPGCLLTVQANGIITKPDKPPAKKPPVTSPYVLPGVPDPKTYGMNKAKIRNRVYGMVNMLQRNRRYREVKKLFFWTVSFMEGTTDENCSRLFNTWLTTLRQKDMLRSYLWVKERQENGTAHYHILIPHWMNVHKANKLMRESICFLIRKGVITNWNLHKAKRYNGVDIAKNRKTKAVVNFADAGKKKSLAKYITKYVTKNDVSSVTRCWHNSRDWSLLITAVAATRPEIKFLALGRLDPDPARGDFADFYRWANWDPPPELCQHFADLNFDILNWHFDRPDNFFFSMN